MSRKDLMDGSGEELTRRKLEAIRHVNIKTTLVISCSFCSDSNF